MKNLILFLFLSLIPMGANAAWEVVAPYVASYSASAAVFTPYATPSDLCAIGGSTAVTIRVYHVRVWGTQTTGGVNAFFLVKRSTYSAGPNTPLTPIQHDSYIVAPNADLMTFLSAPSTIGKTVGIIRGSDVFTAAPAGLASSYFDFDFGLASGVQPIVLHANEMLALNFGNIAVPAGMKISCEFNWTEN